MSLHQALSLTASSPGAVTAGRRLLVITAEAALARALLLTLEGDGYLVWLADDLIAGLERLREGLPVLVMIVATTPGFNAGEVVIAVRERSLVPLLVLLATPDSATIVRILELGADECCAWPMPPTELLARLRALLRRAELPPLVAHTMQAIDAELSVDFSRALITVRGQPVELRPTEYRLLYHLASNPGRVLTYDSLLTHVWGPEYRDAVHYVRLYIAYLRQKIEPDPAHPRYILTVRGLGYRFVDYRVPTDR